MKNILLSGVFLSFLLSAPFLSSLDLINVWRHSEIADKNSVFFDLAAAPFLFEDFKPEVIPMELRLEYFPPFPLPFAVGLFFKTPNPNLRSFGVRASYHFDVFDPYTDLYFVYSHDFGYLRNDLLLEYNDVPVDPFYYDFRVGVRRFFGFLGLSLETGFHFESIIVMLSIKIN